MKLSLNVVRSLVEELSEATRRGVVRKVWCGGPVWFVLEVRVPGENQYIVYSLDRQAERVHLVPHSPKQPPSPPSFVMLLRKHLVGGHVQDVRMLGEDRVVALEVARMRSHEGEEGATRQTVTLVFELFGVHSNIVLLSDEGRVIASMRHPSTLSSERTTRTGDLYALPPTPETVPSLDPLGICALPADGSRSRALYEHIEPFLEHRETHAVARSILRRLRTSLKRARRTANAVERDLKRAEEATSYKVYGELLQAAYGKVDRGASSVTVTDYYDPELREVTIALDPKIDLKSNIQRYFRLYRRYSDALSSIEDRQMKLWERVEATENALHIAEPLVFIATRGHLGRPSANQTGESVSPDEALTQLVALSRHWRVQGVLPPERAQVRRSDRQNQAPPAPYRTFTSKTGKTILVGKNSKHNDTLSIRIARGSDLWLHAHNHAGSHVVVRLNRNQEPDHETLLDAATLAAHYSKARNNTHIDILYTRAKHVRKPKGAPAGSVSVAASKTLSLRLEPKRVRRLFDSSADA